MAVQNVEQKTDWALTPEAFRKLLAWLGADAAPGEEAYLEIRRRLVAYFDRKNCLTPDELADETLNRVARRLEEETAITGEAPAQYCYIVARYVFLEYWRGAQRNETPLDATHQQLADENLNLLAAEAAGAREKLLNCLEECTAKLDPQHRDLIVRYYVGEQRAKIENRRALAAELGLSVNALSIRACRIRDKLEACVHKCGGRR